MKNVVHTSQYWCPEAGAVPAATRDQVAPFMSRYYVYIYYEWLECKHAARRRLVCSVILAGAAGRCRRDSAQGLRPAGAAAAALHKLY